MYYAIHKNVCVCLLFGELTLNFMECMSFQKWIFSLPVITKELVRSVKGWKLYFRHVHYCWNNSQLQHLYQVSLHIYYAYCLNWRCMWNDSVIIVRGSMMLSWQLQIRQIEFWIIMFMSPDLTCLTLNRFNSLMFKFQWEIILISCIAVNKQNF